ncbi:MAG: orotate phosphoribosyltransferase [Pseudomonadota bacterium]
MTPDMVLKEFEEAGALLTGHFVLSSGLHSDTYLNKSIVSMYPERTARLCAALANSARQAFGREIDYVVSPAMGAIIYGYETARHLEVPFIFVERVDGVFQFRRGFQLPSGASVVVVEDIVSTGLSARECLACVSEAGGNVVGLACLIDRSNGRAAEDDGFGVPFMALATMDVKAYEPDSLPPELQSIPAIKPGSRGVSQ